MPSIYFEDFVSGAVDSFGSYPVTREEIESLARVVIRRLLIVGRVQGVGYRQSMLRKAHALGVRGWVRNRRDGTVEALFRGDAEQVETMVEACRHGPMLAKVTDIQLSDVSGEKTEFPFQIRETV